MIYPEIFPEERNHEHAEKKVFDSLKAIQDQYDIFYSRSFVTDGVGKRPEYEIDFIIVNPQKAIICLEVKGGQIKYSGSQDSWFQNSKALKKSPDKQAQSASHSLLNLFSNLLYEIPVGWGLCFPDCQLIDRNNVSPNVSKFQIIDEQDLNHIDKSLPMVFDFVQNQYPDKKGIKRWQYEKFKKLLLRDIGFVQILSTKIFRDERQFVKLTKQQLNIFTRVAENKNVITNGPAGSGKTIIAKTLAQDLANEGLKVLFLCFNRTLANKIRYEFDREEKNIEVKTFHSLSRNMIENEDATWWSENKNKEDFWDIEVPFKFESLSSFIENCYDALIVDEGQDFKELWYDVIFKMIKPEGRKYIFVDQMQDIFNRFTQMPGNQQFFTYSLYENCRNTTKIVDYLSQVTKKEIKVFENSPPGDDIVIKEFKNQIAEQKFLLDEIKSLTIEHSIQSNQILIILNSSKEDSCISNVKKIGKFDLKSLDNKARFERDTIHYTTINTFKGLEADVVFIVDSHLIDNNMQSKVIYTEASRAKHKLYILKL
jgi:hypothetical protein